MCYFSHYSKQRSRKLSRMEIDDRFDNFCSSVEQIVQQNCSCWKSSSTCIPINYRILRTWLIDFLSPFNMGKCLYIANWPTYGHFCSSSFGCSLSIMCASAWLFTSLQTCSFALVGTSTCIVIFLFVQNEQYWNVCLRYRYVCMTLRGSCVSKVASKFLLTLSVHANSKHVRSIYLLHKWVWLRVEPVWVYCCYLSFPAVHLFQARSPMKWARCHQVCRPSVTLVKSSLLALLSTTTDLLPFTMLR